MRKERMNNKGFSLVELIIVIAIMAILAAALAPQLMKYIEKSRVSTDASTCSSIESCVNAALADEDAYKQVAAKASGAAGTHDFEFLIRKDSSANGPEFTEIKSSKTSGATEADCKAFADELCASLSSIKDPKQTGMTAYKVTIVVKQGSVTNSSIHSTATTTEEVTEIGDIKVQTVKAPTTGTWNK